MRRCLPWFLVLLLTLRGLLGDAMAMDLAGHLQTAPADSHGHASPAPQAPALTAEVHCATHPDESQPQHQACTDCAACHLTLAVDLLLARPSTAAAQRLRPVGHSRFTSKASAPAYKPPIAV